MKTVAEKTGTKNRSIHRRTGRDCGRGAGWADAVRLLAAILVLTTLGTRNVAAKSLYVIAEIVSYDEPTPIHAYDIGPDGKLTFQAEYGAPFNGSGVVGLAIDSLTEHLFVTYQDSNRILTFNARTFSGKRLHTVWDASSLAGIVYDHGRELLYVVDRGTTNLYAYHWDAEQERLLSVAGSPFMLKDASAYGLALDEADDLLYVGNAGREITVYSTQDWRLLRKIPIPRAAISVAVDPERGCLYYGAGYLYNYFLSRIDLATGAEKEVQIGQNAGVIGLGVDLATGLIHVTTGRDSRGGGDDLLVFNSDLQIVQTLNDVGNPTGVAIPNAQVSYNPLHLQKTVKSPLAGRSNAWDPPRIAIGDEVTYIIGFNREGYDLEDVSIVDRLPDELAFVGATGDGVFGHYDPNTHTYRWTNPPRVAGTMNLELTGLLVPETRAGQVVTNLATMDTNVTPPTTTGVEAVATEVVYWPLNVSKTVVTAAGAQEDPVQPEYALAGDQITYRICIDNEDNAYAVSNVSATDRLPQEATFVGAWEVDPVTDVTGERTGDYDAAAHTYLASFGSLRPGEVRCIDLTVQLDDTLEADATVTNRVEVASEETPTASDSAKVVIGNLPLDLHKIIVDPVGKTDDRGRIRIEAGHEVTYQIRFGNPSGRQTVSQVVIEDRLPAEVNFVTADGDRDFGSYDAKAHTYTWQYFAPLGPGEEVGLELVGEIRADTEPNTVISNLAVITSRETISSQARRDAVVVVTPVRGELLVRPGRLCRDDTGPNQAVLAAIALPEGYGRKMIADVPLVLQPSGARPLSMRIYGTDMQGKVLCVFDRTPILKATEGSGEFHVVVTGKLVDGRFFVGRDTIRIDDCRTDR